MQPDERKYYLTIRRGKNSYLPVDWTETKYYDGENLYSLSGIDRFTSKVLSLDLLKECLRLNLLQENDLFSSLEILYIEHDVNHTVKEGPIFKEDDYILSEDILIEYIIYNRHHKETINNILMQCNIKESDEYLEFFKNTLKTIDNYGEDISLLRASLNMFKNCSYFVKRAICFRVSNSIYKGLNKNSPEKLLKDDHKVA